MADDERYSMTFRCLECEDGHTGLFVGGIPDAVECPSCGATFPLSELDGFEVTIDPEMSRETGTDDSGSEQSRDSAGPPPVPETDESTRESTTSKQSFEAPDSTLVELDSLVASSSPSTRPPSESSGAEHRGEGDADESTLADAAALEGEELRDVFGRRELYLRTANAEIGPVDADQFVTIVKEGGLTDVQALRERGEDWVERDHHPLINELRERLAGRSRRDSADGEVPIDETPEKLHVDDAASDEDRQVLPAGESSITPPSDWRDSGSETSNRATRGRSPGLEHEKAAAAGEPERSDTRARILWTATAGGIVAALLGAGVYYFLETRSKPSGSSVASTTNRDVDAAADAQSAESEPIAEAIERASRQIRDARDIDPASPELQLRVARRLAGRGDHARASQVYDVVWNGRQEETADVPTFIDSYLRSLEQSSRWQRLRAVLVDAFQSASDADREQFRERFRRSIDSDPLLGDVEPVRLGDDMKFSAARPAEESDAEGWFLLRNGTPAYLFRPATSEDVNWLDDVAAWRLCRILACPFEMPETRPASIERSYFKQLAGSSELPGSVEWTEEEDGNGETRLVYGSLKAWPGRLVRWPIERDGVWRRWLGTSETDANLDAPVRAELRRNWGADGGSIPDALDEHLADTSVRSIARQLSAAIAFDFLVNNWGRFVDDQGKWGSHNHFRDGRFVTVWTGTVFQGRKSRRVEGRFHWCDRFSRDFVTAIRLLPREETFDALYPKESGSTEHKFEIFWEQRRALLDRIDSLVREHGRAEVLEFE